jgi:hypothetical protein
MDKLLDRVRHFLRRNPMLAGTDSAGTDSVVPSLVQLYPYCFNFPAAGYVQYVSL